METYVKKRHVKVICMCKTTSTGLAALVHKKQFSHTVQSCSIVFRLCL